MTIHAHGIVDYDFEDFIELDHDDAFSIFSEDWEELCSEDGDGDERTDSSVLRGELTTGDHPLHISIPD